MVVEEQGLDPADPGQTSASVTLLPIDERLSASTDVAAVVMRAPGTVLHRLGGLGDYASISIRGSSARQVQVFLDGVPLNPDGSAAINLAEFPLQAFSRIEVYRGNAPPIFGASPIGGVVNLVTASSPPPASGTLSGGQYGTHRLTAMASQDRSQSPRPHDVLLFAESFATQGNFTYFTDNATPYNLIDDARLTRDNNDKRQFSGMGRLRAGSDALRVTINDAALYREEGLPGHIGVRTEAVRLETLRNLLTMQVDGSTTQSCWQARLWNLFRQEVFDDRADEFNIGASWQARQYLTTGLLASGGWTPVPWLVPTVTLSARQDRHHFTDLLTEQDTAPNVRHAANLSVGAQTWFADEQVTFSPVLQGHLLDSRQLHTDGATAATTEDTLWAFTPRGGVLIRPHVLHGLALKANVGRYFRPPDFTELFGNQGSVVGNPDLMPEQGFQWDAGIHYTLPNPKWFAFTTDLSWFSSETQNQIVLLQNSQRTSIPTNLGEAYTAGLESGWGMTFGDLVDSQSSLTWNLSENRTPQDDVFGRQIPRIPALEFHQSTSLHHNWLRMGHTFDYMAGNYWDAPNILQTPPRAIHGAFVRLGGTQWSAEASVLNLTDQTVAIVDRNPLSDRDNTPSLQPITDFIGFPLPGRTWLMTVRWTL